MAALALGVGANTAVFRTLNALRRGNVLRMVLAGSLLLCAAGLAAGIPLALAAGKLLRSQIHLSFADPLSFVIAAANPFAAALAATLIPALRASRHRSHAGAPQ